MYIDVSLNKHTWREKENKKKAKKKSAFIGVFSLKELLARLCSPLVVCMYINRYIRQSYHLFSLQDTEGLLLKSLWPTDTRFSKAFHLQEDMVVTRRNSDRPCDQALSLFSFFVCFVLGLESACQGILRRLLFCFVQANLYFCVVKDFMKLQLLPHPLQEGSPAWSLFKSLLTQIHAHAEKPQGLGGEGVGNRIQVSFCSCGSLNLLRKSRFPHPGSCQKGERKLVFGGPAEC